MKVDLSDEDIETLYQNWKDLNAMHYAFGMTTPKISEWLAKLKTLVDRIEKEKVRL